ncbi:MAG: hypothetical protein PHV30_06665 [Candidatus Margulisbacteria bacterium]|nr:hypothetical protein [Candidatus Margulisiibacteriota bacterium]
MKKMGKRRRSAAIKLINFIFGMFFIIFGIFSMKKTIKSKIIIYVNIVMGIEIASNIFSSIN